MKKQKKPLSAKVKAKLEQTEEYKRIVQITDKARMCVCGEVGSLEQIEQHLLNPKLSNNKHQLMPRFFHQKKYSCICGDSRWNRVDLSNHIVEQADDFDFNHHFKIIDEDELYFHVQLKINFSKKINKIRLFKENTKHIKPSTTNLIPTEEIAKKLEITVSSFNYRVSVMRKHPLKTQRMRHLYYNTTVKFWYDDVNYYNSLWKVFCKINKMKAFI